MKNKILSGLPAMMMAYLLWGTQPLYFSIFPSTDTIDLMLWRTLFAALFCFIIICAQKKTRILLNAFCNTRILKIEIPATLFLATDWIVYLIAIKNGQVQECALGYYIQPIVIFSFGIIFFKEKFSFHYIFVFLLILTGIFFFAKGIGKLPYVTIVLSFAFSIYASLKKGLQLDSITSTSMEIILMAPVALILLLYRALICNMQILSGPKEFFYLIGSGLVTCLPMLFYGLGVVSLPLTVVALCNYMSPSINLISSIILGESVTKEKIISFVFVWAGIILFTSSDIIRKKKLHSSL